ncbi:OmpA family protein [Paracoccus sp. (in: a-proteobacteria)]|uniref:OmpA family protein n=1 Tax=Paracoccus sp. TaxID=267 RepID=UPI00396C3FBB
MASSRRRFLTTVATVLVLTGAGGLCWVGAEAAATFIEDRTVQDVTLALDDGGHDWAQVRTDGLLVQLAGTAPSEAERFAALSQVATAVDGARIVDQTSVAAVEPMTPPDFKIELLENEAGTSLIGLVPATTDRAAILRELGHAPGTQVSDLLESADHPAPPHWDEALRLALQAAGMTEQAKISVAPGQVQVAALADDAQAAAQLEAALQQAKPQGVTLDMQITAPRPVIAPFVLRFVMDQAGPRLEACAAEEQPVRQRIIAAAQAAGFRAPDCALGLGAPSDAWGDAAVAVIEAVAQLGQGQVTVTDADIALVAPAGVEPQQFDAVVARLNEALPAAFTLNAQLEKAQPVATAPIEFLASLSDDGALSMRGRIADGQMRQAVDSFARSRFQVAQSGLRSDERVPGGWTVRVIAGLEAMSALKAGEVQVTPDMVSLKGVSGDPQAAELALELLTERLGPGAPYQLAIAYDRRLDTTLGLPDGEECAARLNRIMSESEIGFEPNRSSIAGDPAPTLARMAEAMTDCAEFPIEAGGHTDAQGSQGFNADLSRGRAQAIVAAMQQAGITVTNMTARGYGESQPVATNETDEGREANRRIEFRLLSPHAVRSEPLPTPVTVSGVTGQPIVMAAERMAGPDMEVLSAGRMQGPNRPEPPAAPALPPMQGPQLPHSNGTTGMAPMTVGVREEFQSLDEREENIRVPVLNANDTTPRPGPRPQGLGPDAAEDETTR